MRWLTLQQVERAAKRGPKAALKCSMKHWEQDATATFEEMKDYSEIQDNDPGSGAFCALCEYYEQRNLGCENCILYNNDDDGCCEEYFDAQREFIKIDWYDPATYPPFTKAAGKMYLRLRREWNKKYLKDGR